MDEAEALVAKLLAWEDSGQGLAGAAALVADNPDAGGRLRGERRRTSRTSFLAGPSDHRDCCSMRELGARDAPAILDAFDQGLSLLSYVGHGGRGGVGERERLELLGRGVAPGPVAGSRCC